MPSPAASVIWSPALSTNSCRRRAARHRVGIRAAVEHVVSAEPKHDVAKAVAGQDFSGAIACGRAHEIFEQSCYILGAGVMSEQGDAPER